MNGVVYRHYKNDRYYMLLGVVVLESDHAVRMAVYQDADSGDFYTRPLSEFTAIINGVCRFTPINDYRDASS